MKCPFCGFDDSKVIDSRSTVNNERIRRRRECLKCKRRFTTYEAIETAPIIVIKRDMSRQPFDREKLISKLLRACGKRPVPLQFIEQAVCDIENELLNSFTREVSSKQIAQLSMKKLKSIDIVAYIRFISVYREFSSIDEFLNELKNIEHN